MNKYIISIITLMAFLLQISVYGQSAISVSGLVMSESGEELVGVTIIVKETPAKGTITDIDGRFSLSGLEQGQTLVFSSVGFEKVEMKVDKTNERMRVALKEDVNALEELVIVGHSTQRKISVVGAVVNVEVKDLKVPATSISNMLGGRVPGIISVTRSGEPGRDFSEFWIRGISTFGAGSGALVLIDGVEGNLNTIDPEDIENFSILKDASATAVYGVRGANGVVLITTKRGKAGKLSVNLKANTGFSHSPRMPNYVDANQYATLANEAAMSRGMDPVYNAVDLELFKNGTDPDLHPNVDWRDVILKDHTWNEQLHLSASGGGQVARYYMSIGMLNKDALFKQDPGINKYETNVSYRQYNARANVDMNLTPTSVMSIGLENVVVSQNFPGFGDDSKALWNAQANITPTTVPVVFSSGHLPAYGDNNDQISPYVLLNYTGYRKYYRNTNNLNVQFQQDLKSITEGLTFAALFNMNSNNQMWSSRQKLPALYYARTRRRDGSLDLDKRMDASDPNYSVRTEVDRKFYFEGRSNYERLFGDRHRIGGLVHFYMEDFVTSKHVDDLKSIPKRYLGLSSRATYSYDDTYFIEGNIGYTGSEAFESGKKFGVFPAISLGWIPTQYTFVKSAVPMVNYLKFRGSYGTVGNDRMNENFRFPYLTLMGSSGGSLWGGAGYTETQVGSSNLRWETATKSNFGIDMIFFKNQIDMSIDFYKDIRSGIYQQRASIPDEMGLVTLPFANVGKMKSWGIDGHIAYTKTLNNHSYFILRANYTQSKNEILEYEESIVRFPYQSTVGYQWEINRGLIALGLFQDEEDVINSPRQTFGDVMPGDIKYKDINGDGIIDDYDVVPLEYSRTPQVLYGFASEFNWKKWNVSALFEGVSRVKYFSFGSGFFPFSGREIGNVLDIVAVQSNRWTSAEISGDPSTENPHARFPRLTYGWNSNNNRTSTFWLNDGSYIRLKNVQISYKTQDQFLQKLGISSATLSLIGENLYVWDKVKIFDPAQAKDNGAEYPIQRVYTLQMNLKF